MAALTPKAFLSDPKAQDILSLFIQSPDRFRADSFIAKHAQKVFGTNDAKHVRWNRVRATDLSVEKLPGILESLLSPSLFSQKEITIIADAENLKSSCDESLRKTLSEASHLEGALYFVGTKPPAKSDLKKFFQKREAYIAIPQLQPAEAQKWVTKRCKEIGFEKVEERLAVIVSEMADNDVDKMNSALEQLYVYSASAASVDRFAELFPSVPTPNEFVLQETIAQGRVEEADLAISELLRQGKSPFFLLAILGRSFRTLSQVVMLKQAKKTPQQIALHLELKPWMIKKQWSFAGRYKAQHVTEILEGLLECENRLKAKSLGPELIFSRLVRRLAP